MRPLLSIAVRNFRSLENVSLELRPLNVLVGPNEAGKSNFLDLIEFLGDCGRLDLAEAIDRRGGIDRVRFRGESRAIGTVSIEVKANVTSYSSESAPDEYGLDFWTRRVAPGTDRERVILFREEHFTFKRVQGRGRRITVAGERAEITDVRGKSRQQERLALKRDSLALSTLRRLPPGEGGEEIDRVARLFTSFRVFNVDTERARVPGRLATQRLEPDASNLATFLMDMSLHHPERFEDLLEDARAMVPGLEAIEFAAAVEDPSAPVFTVSLRERGLKDSTYLADASFGTVRILSLLALLYDPDPPHLTCIEEVDHGLHPYVFDRLVERLREASTRTQLLIATHSPALVNRLHPEELVVVERGPGGETRMPAVETSEIRAKQDAAGDRLRLGEIWFSGALGGVPR